ncbi:hypothetical protein HD554DRAFT_2166553 [Boletus coccyginus]|nr:hypothetical protein HD554DRAFT_2166553 [Boletus coccyginus]
MAFTPINSTINGTELASQFAETSFYVGLTLQNILYGIELCLYFRTIHISLSRRGAAPRSTVFYQVFSTVMLVLTTVWVAAGSRFGQELWVLGQNYPGGPIAYGLAHTSDLYNVVSGAASIVLQLMADFLMAYRCRIVWGSYRAIIIPTILWIATFVLGTLIVWTSSIPQTIIFNGRAAELGLAYYSTSVLLHATLTCTICSRFVCHARKMKELGEEYASPYFNMIRVFFESSLLFTLAGIAYLVSYGLGDHTELAFSRVYVLMMCISPQLLILRVTEGSAWKKGTMKPLPSVIVFSPDRRETLGSGRFDGKGARAQYGSLSTTYHPEPY